MVSFNAEDVSGKQYDQLKLFVEQELSEIENIDLFKSILNGDLTEVQKFEYNQDLASSSSDSESEGEKKKWHY